WLGGSVVAERHAAGAHAERDVERQRAGSSHGLACERDRARFRGRHEMPRPAPAIQPADFIRQVLHRQPDFAEGSAAHPDRNPGNLHDANRARFTLLNVEACGFRHRGIDPSLSPTLIALDYPRSTNKSVPPASQRFQVPPRALAEIATAGSSTVHCTTD